MLDLIKSEAIVLDYDRLDFSTKKLYGVYFYERVRQKAFIVLERRIDTRPTLHRCVLAEELGHYFTVPCSKFTKPYVTYADRLKLTRDERRALSWAARFLISDDDLKEALAYRYRNLSDLAEHLGVTIEIARMRLEIHRMTA
ncbi:ImmA/IrrE family metallo-endopeptidase [Alicyclobacillus macrosporangiidus]|uniref:ImmA/IrrE family metallo-endopeptidase n=1 Tax=Alicyclobacillus macrosporangiidus TaxID=392015 RepID=UPI003AFA92CA